ncbi:MAG TPA: bifunctional methylenetetrahydrofolate dehydrogenase/methenyltetrahydrofolate cyclohydrolase FolD [Methyloceanibacter sp.]|nr:bifunctional methylenetetrahydrofolate dehydrogenase/methenyltetrahydrofolate cyclohydrolase FolD [Methyloceanibacter sp.]
MTATIIDGKAIAAKLSLSIADAVRTVTAEHGIEPGLAIVLVGDNAASEVYVRSKTAKTAAVNMRSLLYKLPATARPEELLALIEQLNQDPAVHGILVQLPLPPQIDSHKVIEAIAPAKDVDGFHPLTAGLLSTGLPGIVPCTPLACIILAKHILGSLAGKEAVVIGRSNIVGKPLAQLLLMENATVTITHSKTRDLPAVSRRGDIVFAAVGQPEIVRRDWIKPGATVIDVGINRVPTTDGKSKLVGDVAFDEVAQSAGAITPVPGGVGPMTIACLMLNTLKAACAQAGIEPPRVPGS